MKTKMLSILLLTFLIQITFAKKHDYETLIHNDVKKIKSLTFVSIPDPNFEQALINSGYDDVLDQLVSLDNIINIAVLQLSDKNISDLTGIEEFINLTDLDVSNNKLTSIDVTNLTKLVTLNLDNNLITATIDFSKNIELENLKVRNNKLETIDVSKNTELVSLDLSYNLFTTLDFTFNTKLSYLNVAHRSRNISGTGGLSNLTFSNLTSIDISKNTLLQEVYLQNNLLTTIDVSNNLMLTTLDISDNELNSLNVKTIETLTILKTSGNNLNCVSVFNVEFANQNWKTYANANTIFSTNCDDFVYVPDDNFEQALIDLGYDTVLDDYINKQDVINVTSLDVSNKQIDDLTGIEAFTALENLNASNNLGIDDLNITTLTNLKILNIDNNLIYGTIDITKNIALEELYAGSNDLKTLDVTQNINLKKLNLIYNQLTEIDLSNNIQLTYLNIINGSSLANSKLTAIDISKNTLLQELYLQGNLLSTIDVSKNTNLTKLLIPSNNLATLDVSNNVMLNTLGVSNNNLSSLNISMLESLLFFSSKSNNLHCVSVFDVDFANQNWKTNSDENTIFSTNCDDLVYVPDDNFEQALIDLGYDTILDNYISSEVAKTITTLSIYHKQISDLTGIEEFINLKELNCGKNNLTSIDITKNIKLEKAFLNENNIYYVDISKNTELNLLAISRTSISFIDTFNNAKLKTLTAFSSQLNYIDISNNPLLETLQLDHNHLTEININKNTKLKIVDLGRNNIKTINLTKNTNLESLNLESNDVSVLDIKNNFRLTTFNARNNNNLICITTWDVNYANQNWSQNIDATASFGDNCYTYIPDDNFELALINEGLDTVLDNYVLTSNISNLLTLFLDSKFIADATGIENFINLKELSLKGNELTTINLSQNTQLLNLNLSNNKLNRLDISNNKLLENFEAVNNKLTCIKVWDENYAKNSWTTAIDINVTFSLDCDEVWTIEVDDTLKSLITIVIGLDKDNDGEITLAEAKEFTGALNLSGKNLDDIKGLEAFVNLTTLDLSNNNIKDLSKLTGKKITLISKSSGKRKVIDVASLALETLKIDNNSIETLNLDNLINLKSLDVSNNPDLTTMSIRNGNNINITNFNATNTPNLSCILVDNPSDSFLTTWQKETKTKFVQNEYECRQSVLEVDVFTENDFTIYPNPVNSILIIHSEKLIDKIEVFNTLGKKIVKTIQKKIDFSSYPSGIYFIKVVSNNMVVTKRILKN